MVVPALGGSKPQGIEVGDGGGGGAVAASHEESEEQDKKQVNQMTRYMNFPFLHVLALANSILMCKISLKWLNFD